MPDLGLARSVAQGEVLGPPQPRDYVTQGDQEDQALGLLSTPEHAKRSKGMIDGP